MAQALPAAWRFAVKRALEVLAEVDVARHLVALARCP